MGEDGIETIIHWSNADFSQWYQHLALFEVLNLWT